MTGRFVGRFKHRDGVTKVCEPVRDDWSAENPEPVSDSEIFRMSAEQYRSWKETGRKPVMDDDPQEFDPVADTSCKAAEAFVLASDRRHGYRSATSADQSLTPEQRFARASADRHRVNPRYPEEARRRRRD